MGPPASSTSVLSPASASSFAAHPPVMPEPTTMASKSYCAAFKSWPPSCRARRRDMHVGVESARQDHELEDVLLHRFAGEVAVNDQFLDVHVAALRWGKVKPSTGGIERRDHLRQGLILEARQRRAGGRERKVVDGAQVLEKARAPGGREVL